MSDPTYWKTIEYIGSGYVLQLKMEAVLNQDGNSIERKQLYLDKTTQRETREHANYHKNKYDEEYYNVTAIKDVQTEHRVVHVTELNGVDSNKLVNDMQERFK